MKAKLTIVDSVAQKQEDIFTVGNLVVSRNYNEIVFVTCTDSGYGSFAGVCLESGKYSATWIKEAFTQYRGSVTLSTEE